MADFLALDWEQHQVCGLEAHVEKDHVRVRSCFVLRWPDGTSPAKNPDQAGKWLREQLQQHGVSSKQTLISLPRDETVVRPLDLPEAPANELPDLVRLQAATKSVLPLDELLLDYVPLPPTSGVTGQNVLMATISTELVDKIRRVTDAAGLELTSIGISSFASAELVAQVERRRGDNRNDVSLIVGRQDKRVEVTVMRGEHLLFTHSKLLDGNDAAAHTQAILAEVSRSVVALGETIPGLRIARVWVLGTGDEDAQLCDALQKRLACDSKSSLDPFTDVPITMDTNELPDERGQYAGPLGMVLSQSGASIEAVDFLNPRRAAVRRDLKKLQAVWGAAAVAALILVTFGIQQVRQAGLDREIERLQAEKLKLDPLVRAGQPDLELAGSIGDWTERNVHWIDQVREFNRVLGSTDRMYLSEYRVIATTRGPVARIHATGFARGERDVRLLPQKFADNDYRVNPDYRLVRNDDDSEYPYRFELKIELVSALESDDSTDEDATPQTSTTEN